MDCSYMSPRDMNTRYPQMMMPPNAPICPNTGACCMEEYPIGMGYIPWQQWQQTYTIDRALQRGTIFPTLDLPFQMGRCR
ncbi:MAG: spore coat associated protein CotJA [Hungatella sp.]